MLKSAWQEFASCDQLAKRLRTLFSWGQVAILLLGVTATLLALIYDETHARFLHWLVVAAPILVSTLIALAGRHAAGQRWVLLRGAAQGIRAEIFRYRTRTSPYGEGTTRTARHRTLAERLDADQEPADADRGQHRRAAGLRRTAAASHVRRRRRRRRAQPARTGALSQHPAERPAGLLRRRRGQPEPAAVAGPAPGDQAGGAGSLLAAVGFDIWVGLTGGIAAASLAYLGYLQIDNTIVTYNQAAAKLAGLKRQWLALDAGERGPIAFGQLVEGTEQVLNTELASCWVQQMNDAMADLKTRDAEQARHDQPDPTAP